jgi:Mu transposase, C-terminal domain
LGDGAVALVSCDAYSVPHRLVRDHVEALVEDCLVRIFHGAELVATHARSTEPFARVVEMAHYAGLWRSAPDGPTRSGLGLLGGDLADYAAVVDGAK